MKTRFSCSWTVWSQFVRGSALNLFQLARLLAERGLSMVLCHGKKMLTFERDHLVLCQRPCYHY